MAALQWGWGMYNQNFGVNQIEQFPEIICVGYQWLGKGPAQCLTQWDMTQEEMLQTTLDLIKQADAVVGKNSDKFDLKWIRTELLRYKLPPLPPITSIDLEKAAKNYFRFHSNKLEYILLYLGMQGKLEHEGFGLWHKAYYGHEPSRRKMIRYCMRDVKQTGLLYKRMLPFIENHPALRSLGSTVCPKCQSRNTKKDGIRRTACFHIQTHQCNSCGGYFSGKRTKVA
jgi:hypothetical protein